MTTNAYPTPESEGAVLAQSFPLDAQFYSLNGEELDFMKDQTGILDNEALKNHILRVQAKAYNVSCSRFQMSSNSEVLALGTRFIHIRVFAALASYSR